MNWRNSQSFHALPGADDIQRVELENGITLLMRRNPFSPSVVLSGYLPAGSQYDPPEKLGLAYLTALGLTRGTQRRNFQQIFETLETAGASLGFAGSVHTVSFGGRSLVEDLPILLELLAEVLIQPVFPSDQVERLRVQHLTALAIRAQDTAEMASLVFDEILFDNHPYGKPEDGYPQSIQNIQREDLLDFHQKYYSPAGMVLAVVGGIEPAQVLDWVNQHLGSWQNQTTPPAVLYPPLRPLDEDIRRHISIDGKSQCDLVVGTFGPRRTDADFFPAIIGNNILGQLGMMGRIGEVIREQYGLAYYAAANLVASTAAGSWEVSAGVDPQNLQQVIDLIRDEIACFTHEPVSEEELSNSKANLIGRLPLALESNSGVAGALLNIERYGLGLDYYRRYPSMIEKVSREDVLETARRYLKNSGMVIVSAGPDGSNEP
ncbi:MAG: pitrilysin family protein [Chloroflexota bacterium]